MSVFGQKNSSSFDKTFRNVKNFNNQNFKEKQPLQGNSNKNIYIITITSAFFFSPKIIAIFKININ